jgi:hypothetical protein
VTKPIRDAGVGAGGAPSRTRGAHGNACGPVDVRGNDAQAMMPRRRCRSALDHVLGARGGRPARRRRELHHQAARRLEEALGRDGVLDFIG